jgi:multidrug efflux pump subunit AcrA (membrane-fusion protein)
VCVGILLLAGCRQNAKADGGAETDASVKPIVQVEVQPVVGTSLDETVEALGTTQPLRSRTARVTTAIEGRVAEILPAAIEPEMSDSRPQTTSGAVDSPPTAVEGQMVTERQVIVRLDDSLARAAVAKADGALAEAQAAAAAQSVSRPQQLQAAEAALASAGSALKGAEEQLKRLRDIGERLVGSASLADAQTAVERARSDKHAAEAHLAELSELPAARKAAELQAKVRAAEADLTAAQMQLELCKIRSPIAGRLGQVSIFLGQSLAIGTPVATVTDLRQIGFEAAVPAKRIQLIQVGQPATIVWGDDAAPQTLPGKVTFVGQEIEPGSGSFRVIVVAENPEERLRSGLHVHARIVVRHLENVLVVPRAAVIEETDDPYLFVAEQKGDKLVARRVPVKPGVRSGDLVQVEGEGIAAGATIVTAGNYFLPDGAEVRTDNGEKKETSESPEKPETAPKTKDKDDK